MLVAQIVAITSLTIQVFDGFRLVFRRSNLKPQSVIIFFDFVPDVDLDVALVDLVGAIAGTAELVALKEQLSTPPDVTVADVVHETLDSLGDTTALGY